MRYFPSHLSEPVMEQTAAVRHPVIHPFPAVFTAVFPVRIPAVTSLIFPLRRFCPFFMGASIDVSPSLIQRGIEFVYQILRRDHLPAPFVTCRLESDIFPDTLCYNIEKERW